MRHIVSLSLVSLLLISLGACTGQALCAKSRECASDPPGEDYERICQVNHDGQLKAYRANKEDVCQALADAKLVYDACRAQLECDDFNEADHNGECEGERDEYVDALRDAEQECGTLD